MRAFVTIAVSILLIPALTPGTSISGTTPGTNQLYGFVGIDQTLTVAAPGPIYYIIGDLVVNPGVTLTIEPGVTVEFIANSDFLGGGNYIDKCELTILGSLIASGASSDSVQFVSSEGGLREWGEIHVAGGASASFTNCFISGGVVLLRVDGQAILTNSILTGGTPSYPLENTGEIGLFGCRVNTGDYALRTSGSATVRYSFFGISPTYPENHGIDVTGSLVVEDSRIQSFGGRGSSINNAGHVELIRTTMEGVPGVMDTGVNTETGADLEISQCEFTDYYYGVKAAEATGFITECTLTGYSLDGTGLQIGPTFSTAHADSAHPLPTVISNYYTGVQCTSTGGLAQHLLVYGNRDGLRAGLDWIVSYCTAVDNASTGFYLSGCPAKYLLNSIAVGNGGAGIGSSCTDNYVNHVNAWNNNQNFSTYLTLGSTTASFNPAFVDPSSRDYRLSEASLFRTFSNSGREIGAYGPGPGDTVQLQETTWGRIKAERR